MMKDRDDWPDGILEGDLDSTEGLDPSARQSAERIARDSRNMDAVLSAMASQLSEGIPTLVDGQPAPASRQPSWKKWTLAPRAAAAAVAALVLVRGEADQSGGLESSAGAPPTTNMMAEMDVEADKPFVVFPTSNPDIAVVWLLNPKESD